MPPVGRLWRLRAVRQMTLGLVPLLVIGLALVIGLIVKAHDLNSRLAPASAAATGTVRTADSANPRHASVSWTDRAGTAHVSRLTFPGSAALPHGTRLSLHYDPGNPRVVFADGDTTYTLLGVVLGEMVLVVVILAVALAVSAVRLTRRLMMMRQPAATLPVSRVHTKLGLIQRSFLVIEQNRREWWEPVFWEPALDDLMASTPCLVYGDPARSGVVVDVAGTTVWPSGRRRATPPRGEHRSNAGRWSRSANSRRAADPKWSPAAQISLGRQARGDAALLLAAPIMGLLWAYIDGLGALGFGLATALFLGVLFWVPSVYGSDPS